MTPRASERVRTMRKAIALWICASACALVGCGGSTNSANPLQNNSLLGKDPSSNVGTKTIAGKPGIAVPVFLSVNPEQLKDDVWIRPRKVLIGSSDATQTLWEGHDQFSLRLAGLRDIEGRLYMPLGMASKNARLVRAQLQLDEAYWVPELGAEAPTKKKFEFSGQAGAPGQPLLTLNLDPNVEFRDAIVLELNLTESADKKSLTPEIKLGSTSFALDSGRQIPGWVRGTVETNTPSALGIKAFGASTSFAWLEGESKKEIEKGDNVLVHTLFDSKSKSMVAQVVQGYKGKDVPQGFFGKLATTQDEGKTGVFEPVWTVWDKPAATSYTLPLEGEQWAERAVSTGFVRFDGKSATSMQTAPKSMTIAKPEPVKPAATKGTPKSNPPRKPK